MEVIPVYENATSRRRKVTKFSLAGVAVLGVGAALTSAAWSDNVFFGGSAEAAAFELQGYDPINDVWVDADTNALRITLPADAFDTVGPDISDAYNVRVYNAGDVPIYLNVPVVNTTAGALFRGGAPATVSFGAYSGDGVLAPGEEENVDVIVTGDISWTGTAYQGTTGTLTVRIAGESSPIVP